MMQAARHLLLTLALLCVLAAAAGMVAYRMSGDRKVETALNEGDALAWLRAEFKLNDEQFERIKSLHESYSGECELHCRAIQEAMRARNAIADAADVDQLAEAEARLETLRETCETAIAAHVRRCAAEMSPAAAERYLAMMLPRIADFDHRAPPDMTLSPHRH